MTSTSSRMMIDYIFKVVLHHLSSMGMFVQWQNSWWHVSTSSKSSQHTLASSKCYTLSMSELCCRWKFVLMWSVVVTSWLHECWHGIGANGALTWLHKCWHDFNINEVLTWLHGKDGCWHSFGADRVLTWLHECWHDFSANEVLTWLHECWHGFGTNEMLT